MKNPATSYKELVAFVEDLATDALWEELSERHREKLTLKGHADWLDRLIDRARKLTGETYKPNNPESNP